MPRTAHTRRLGSVTLKRWVTDRGLTQMGLASRLEITQAAVSNIITGRSTPSLPMACLIEACTRGAVRVTDWLDSEATVRIESIDTRAGAADG